MDHGKFIPKTAAIRPEVVGDIVADVYLMTKQASPKREALEHIGWYTGIPLLMGAGGGLVKHIAGKMDQKKMQDQLEESFNKAMSSASANKDAILQDRSKARQAFNTLAHFSPQVALNPHSAKAFMNKLVSYDMNIDVSDIKNLTEIQKNLSGSNMGHFAQGFDMTNKALGLPGIASTGLKEGLDIARTSEPSMQVNMFKE